MSSTRVLRRHQREKLSGLPPSTEAIVLPVEEHHQPLEDEEEHEHQVQEEIINPDEIAKHANGGLFGGWTNGVTSRPKLTRWVIAGIILFVSFLGLIWYFFGERIMNYLKFSKNGGGATGTPPIPDSRPPPYQEHQKEDDGLQILQRFPKELQDRVKNETEDSLLSLVNDLKANNFQIFGNAQCGFTKVQRTVFGGATSKSRKAFEELFFECFPTNNNCADMGIRAFPTWKHTPTGEILEGFQEPESLRKMIRDIKEKRQQQQPQTQPPPQPTPSPSQVFVAMHSQTTHQQPSNEKPGFVDVTEQEDAVAVVQEQKQGQGEVQVEHVRGITMNPPPLDAPVLPNSQNPNFLPVDASSLRLQQDPARVNNDLDPITQMSATMHQVLQDALNKSNPGKLNNNSYESGTVMGNTKIDLAQDPFAPRNLPLKNYEHRQ